jgi:NADH-quinone oxidoreductase subunit L
MDFLKTLDPSWSFLILFLPLFGSIVWALLGGTMVKNLGKTAGQRIIGIGATAFVLIAAVLAGGYALQLSEGAIFEPVLIFDWISLQNISIPFELRIDSLSVTMAMVVAGIGGLIHWYAAGYMWEDKEFSRFFTYLNLFIAFMLLLVMGNNLAMLFIGWEGVGVCSYLLIGFWYKDKANSKAANKAFIANRIGDFGLTLGLFYLVYILAGNLTALGIEESRWLSYDVFLPHAETIFATFRFETTIICLLLFVGAMGKSAQFPLYVWLPDAMAGPTPVSALIHAATMVTSGVVLLTRMAPLFAQAPIAMSIVALIGAITALLGALIAFGQTDIKKVLAYSTVSQLGYMFIACGVGAAWAGMFHVVTHAFFKALLFLCSGSVIYAMAHNQDMRNYGGLWKKLPITTILMTIGFLALIGAPFLFAGWYSKEAIIGAAMGGGTTYQIESLGISFGELAGIIGLIAAFCTAFYMTRQMWLTFMGKGRWLEIEPAHHDHPHHEEALPAAPAHDAHRFFMSDDEMKALPHEEEHHHDLDKSHEPKEVPVSMWMPLALLAVASTWLLAKPMNSHFQEWITGHEPEVHHGGLLSHEQLIPVAIGVFLLGLGIGIYWYRKGLPKAEGWDMKAWSKFRRSALNQFGIDSVFTDGSSAAGRGLGKFLTWIDVNLVDGLVNGIGVLSKGIGGALRSPQNRGLVRQYAVLMHLGAALLIVLAILKLGVFN